MPKLLRTTGLTVVELLLAMTLAGLLVAGAIRLAVVSSDQQRAVLQSSNLQADLRRAVGVAQQVTEERPFLLPLRGNTAGIEYLRQIPESRFRVLGVSATGLTVRFLNPAYDPRDLRRAVVVDAGGNGYVYSLSRVVVLDGSTGTYTLEGTACTVPSGQGLRGVGASLARFGSGAALNTFAGRGDLPAGTLYFQEENNPAEQLAAISTPGLRYIYRAGDGQTLYQDTVQLYQETGGTRYDLVGVALNFQGQSGTGVREATREISADLLFQADAGLGLRRLDCSPLDEPPEAVVGDWRINVEGLDPGVSALVGVTGPGGFNRTLTASAVLNGLRQGTYSVTADAVVNPGLPFVRYRPTNPAEGSSLGVEVGGANLPVTSVRYTRIPGRLRVQVEGLPAGVTATLRAIGSFASSDFALGSGEQRFNVEAGRYTLEWPVLPDPGGRGSWIPDRNNIGVDVPSDGEGDAGTIRYILEPNPYRLNLNVRLRGNNNGGLSPRVCIQPRETVIGEISPDTEIPDCLIR